MLADTEQRFLITATAESLSEIKVGDRVKFFPNNGTGERWWLVKARDDRQILAELDSSSRELQTTVTIEGRLTATRSTPTCCSTEVIPVLTYELRENRTT